MKKLSLLITLGALAACATPDVIEKRQVGDAQLSCQQISDAIQEANTFEKSARDEKGVTGKNVTAVLLFWPAAVGNYINAENAIEAAEDRKAHLFALSEQKKCDF